MCLLYLSKKKSFKAAVQLQADALFIINYPPCFGTVDSRPSVNKDISSRQVLRGTTMSSIISAGALLATSLFGVKALHIFSLQNGVFDLFFKVADTRCLPNGVMFQPIDTNGRFPIVDRQITTYSVFILAFTEGLSYPDVTLAGILFLGAWGPAWMLIVLESFRHINAGNWLS